MHEALGIINDCSNGGKLKPALESLVDKNGCWIWQRYVAPNGYGRKRVGAIVQWAHIAYYEAKHGPVPSGLVLDHLCRNRACVNPDHLEPVTYAENTRRGSVTKITALEAAKIKELIRVGLKDSEIAKHFPIGRKGVASIRKGECWTDIALREVSP